MEKVFKMPITITDLALHGILSRNGVCHKIGTEFYTIRFNGNDFSAESTEALFAKMKEYYKKYVEQNQPILDTV
jgi:hypothetical protein